jgi:hypothetical protein
MMTVLSLRKTTEINGVPENHFVVVHPLDDAPEDKVDTSALGPMAMTTSVKLSLMALREILDFYDAACFVPRAGSGRKLSGAVRTDRDTPWSL